MNPPKKWKVKRDHGYSLCIGCRKWKKCFAFRHDEVWWSLCADCYQDYWDNCDEVKEDLSAIA